MSEAKAVLRVSVMGMWSDTEAHRDQVKPDLALTELPSWTFDTGPALSDRFNIVQW